MSEIAYSKYDGIYGLTATKLTVVGQLRKSASRPESFGQVFYLHNQSTKSDPRCFKTLI